MSERRGVTSFHAAYAIPVMAVATIVVGFWGWIDHGSPPASALYKAVVLFDIGNDLYLNGPYVDDWRFQLGRWTALGAVFGAAITALAAVLHERMALAFARWFRQDVMVIGGNGLATKAFEAARRAGRSVVWLGAPTLGAASIRVIALPWPPEDRERAVTDYCANSGHVIVAHEDDAGAMTLIRAARKSAPKAFITVLMRDARLAEDAAGTLNEARTRVLSIAERSARAMHIAHPPFLLAREAGQRRIHALLVGFGQTGQAIARDLIVNCRTTYLDLPRITVIDPRAWAQEGVMRLRAPEIEKCADMAFVEGRIGSEAIAPAPKELFEEISRGGPLTAVYICLGHDADALAAAAMLQALLRGLDVGNPPIFVRLRDAKILSAGGAGASNFDALTPFGDLEAVLAASEFLSNAPDAAARAVCEAYRASLRPELRDDPANRSARPWELLDETFRQANRDGVAHVPAKMASVGIDPAQWRGVFGLPALKDGQVLFANDAELEVLARLEHERWNAQRRMAGWRWADLPRRNDARLLSPYLVEYDALTDEVKGYDRTVVRESQMACQRVAKL